MNTYGWTAIGACRILGEEGARLRVLLPERKRPCWISRTQIQPMPSTLRLVKQALFDQRCGCNAVLDVIKGQTENYNVYGSLIKFARSTVRHGLIKSAHHRRVFLHKNGFVRAIGIKRVPQDVRATIFNYQQKGYRLIEH